MITIPKGCVLLLAAQLLFAGLLNAQTGIKVSEGTNLAVTASPAGDRLLLALHSLLYSLPAKGGTAELISDMYFDPFRPAWSPTGDEIAVQSYADGSFHIWLISADGKTRRQLTRGPFEDSYPSWSPDGKQLVFSSNRYGGVNNIWTIDIASGQLRQLTSGAGAKTEPSWSPDGERVAYIEGAGGGMIMGNPKVQVMNLANGQIDTLIPPGGGGITGLSWSPDGARMAYVSNSKLMLVDLASGAREQVADYDDVFPFPPVWRGKDALLYGANGKLVQTSLATGASEQIPFELTLPLQQKSYRKKRFDFTGTKAQPVKGIAGPALSPDGKQVIFKALNDLWLLSVGDPQPKQLTADGFYEVDPAWSRDGRAIVYTSDKGGSPDIYWLDLVSGEERRLTSAPGSEFGAALSSTGQLAYQDESYQTHVLDLVSGETRKVGPAFTAATPGRPSWSADGKTIALVTQEDGRNLISLIDLASGTVRVEQPGPERTIANRGDEGPVWSPDGQWLAFTMEATLWILPVDASGKPMGAARQLVNEVADAPSWKGDSSALLYLHNGRLKMVGIDGNAPTEVPLALSWRNDVPKDSYLIHAGKLMDGRSDQAREHVDILVRGGKIESIRPHSDRAHTRADAEFIDASELTVMPGMFDMHNHQQLKSRIFGDRQGRLFLSFGITSTRSTGDDAYRALEDRESLAAGTRLGPRYFMSGEMLEGARTIWEFARPVMHEQQLALELERIKALDYDLVKTYIRFRHDWQHQIIDWVHQNLGAGVTSHVLYPAVGFGADGVEHMGGSGRYGPPFSFWVSRSNQGQTYQDVVDLFALSGTVPTTTIFSASVLFKEDPDIASDPRIQAFYLPADQRALRAEVDCLTGAGGCGMFLGPSIEVTEQRTTDILKVLERGGTVVTGTDAPLNEPALSFHNDLRALARFGLTPFEVLRLAALEPAKALGVENQLGSVEPGKLADLVFLAGDPATRVEDFAKVRSVMKGGRFYSLEELLGPFAVPANN